MKNLCFGGSFFKMKIANILNFLWIKYLGKGLSYLKNWGIGVYCCWNYEPSKLLLHFIEYRLDQLNNKHTKIAVNSAIQYFEGRSQKKCLFNGSSATKWRPCKIIVKLNGNHLLMANIFKLHKYLIFDLIKMHNMSKIWFASNKFNLLDEIKSIFHAFSRAFRC